MRNSEISFLDLKALEPTKVRKEQTMHCIDFDFELKGNCNHRLENFRLQTGCLQTGRFEMPRFSCSELQRVD